MHVAMGVTTHSDAVAAVAAFARSTSAVVVVGDEEVHYPSNQDVPVG